MLVRAEQKSLGVRIFTSPNNIINKVMVNVDKYPKNKHKHGSSKYGLVIGYVGVKKLSGSPKPQISQSDTNGNKTNKFPKAYRRRIVLSSFQRRNIYARTMDFVVLVAPNNDEVLQ